MGMFDSFNISATGLTAQTLRRSVISGNVANATTTRTPEGGAYKRKRVVFEPVNMRTNYKSPLVPGKIDAGVGAGVRVLKIENDKTPYRLVYDPHHPDAIQTGPKKGYVEMPNVNIVTEMTDMIEATRAYEANVNMVNNAKSMFNKALEIQRA